jgi:ADP-ribose pyrophosphatase
MKETELSSERVFEGRLLKVDRVAVELDDGTRASREVVRHPGAAVVLCRKPDGQLVLVRQYRFAAGCELLEAVAGTLEQGEDPAECARREVEEETGYVPMQITPLGAAYPAPGYTEELLHFYFAEIPAEPGNQATDDDERVEVVELSATDLDSMIAAGKIRDAKTLAAWLLLCRQGANPLSGGDQ